VGLAIASRQPAWFAAPFYLLAIWKRDGRAEAARRAAIIAIVGLAPNLPFMLDNADAFFDGVSAPMLGALAPYGVGFVRLGIDGAFPLLPRAVYSGLSLVSFVALVAVLWRFWRHVPIGAVIFPFVPLYLAWRSLQNYFGSIPLLAMAGDDEVIVGTEPERAEKSTVVAAKPVPATSGVHPTSP
jgi:uncharacterized membrane protein